VLALVAAPQCASLAARGPLTPITSPDESAPPLHRPAGLAGHRGAALAAGGRHRRFRARYDRYFDDQVRAKGSSATKLDPTAGVLLIPGVASSAPARRAGRASRAAS